MLFIVGCMGHNEISGLRLTVSLIWYSTWILQATMLLLELGAIPCYDLKQVVFIFYFHTFDLCNNCSELLQFCVMSQTLALLCCPTPTHFSILVDSFCMSTTKRVDISAIPFFAGWSLFSDSLICLKEHDVQALTNGNCCFFHVLIGSRRRCA